MRFSGTSSSLMTAAGPILFGIAFLAPLIAQSTVALSLPVPFGLQPIQFGLAVGLALGVVAAYRGRWV